MAKTISKKIKDRMLEQAREAFQEFINVPIDWTGYRGEVILDDDGVTAEVALIRKDNKATLRLVEVYFRKENGELLQYGRNYGDLTL